MFWKPETMKNRAVEMSSGVYTYKHHCEGGFDIHEIYIKRSKFRVLFSYVGEIFLFANVLHALLLKVVVLSDDNPKW